MKLSAIVPTHNRPEVLRRCLETLQAQEIAPSELEVMVVDDGSAVRVAELVAEVATRGPIEMRCERIELTGLNGARNRGASVTEGDVLAFLDDDTLVSAGWAAAMLRAFGDHPCAAAGGRVELQLAGPAPDWLAARRSYLAEYDLGVEPFWLDEELIESRDSNPVGANCAVRRGDFDQLGGFRMGLDRIGKSLVSNGDTEFFRRLRAAGGRMRYVPDASVMHCVPADRLTVDFFTRRHYAQGVSDELLLARSGRRASWSRRVELARTLGGAAKLLCKDAIRGRETVIGRFQLHYWAGRLAATGKATPGVAEPTGVASRVSERT
jgi:GT2 family glycosyltransferase